MEIKISEEIKITLGEVIDILGMPENKVSGEYLWQCPYCRDNHKDNMRFNEGKGLLWCFANPEHSKEILKEICAKRNEKKYISDCLKDEKPIKNEVYKWELNKDEYFQYADICNKELLENKELLNLLEEKRGINKNTVEMMWIGFDDTENHWVIPIFSVKHKTIVGFEYRRKNFDAYNNGSKVRRESGYVSTICPIYGRMVNVDTLYICEGFLDAYILYQYLTENKQDNFSIVSCSNGVTSLLNCLCELNFSNYKKIKLMLDNDKAGDDVTKKIIEKYSFMTDARQFLRDSNCKDINEWYLAKKRKEVYN